jgi:hypothetical protein
MEMGGWLHPFWTSFVDEDEQPASRCFHLALARVLSDFRADVEVGKKKSKVLPVPRIVQQIFVKT